MVVRYWRPPNISSAICNTVSVLPTPLGPTNRKAPRGRPGRRKSARAVSRCLCRWATATSCPLMREPRYSGSRVTTSSSPWEMRLRGTPVHSAITAATWVLSTWAETSTAPCCRAASSRSSPANLSAAAWGSSGASARSSASPCSSASRAARSSTICCTSPCCCCHWDSCSRRVSRQRCWAACSSASRSTLSPRPIRLWRSSWRISSSRWRSSFCKWLTARGGVVRLMATRAQAVSSMSIALSGSCRPEM
ncbi:hypothetical protein D3C85_1111080 [compost metagenome]